MGEGNLKDSLQKFVKFRKTLTCAYVIYFMHTIGLPHFDVQMQVAI